MYDPVPTLADPILTRMSGSRQANDGMNLAPDPPPPRILTSGYSLNVSSLLIILTLTTLPLSITASAIVGTPFI